jgi:hypothetical protein
MVLDRAKVPRKPVFPNQIINASTSGILALMLGIFWAFTVEFFSKSRPTEEKALVPIDHQTPMRQPIGKRFLSRGALSQEQILDILRLQQRKPGLLFGEVAVKLGYVSEAQVDEVLEEHKRDAFREEEILISGEDEHK